MKVKKLQKLIIEIIEVILGIVFIIVGFLVYIWARKLMWIAIYPPPWEKQIIGIAPYFLWIIGFLLIVDGIRRVRVVLGK